MWISLFGPKKTGEEGKDDTDLRERERLLEVERKAMARDTLLAKRLKELKNRVDALACANYGLRERLRSQIMVQCMG